MNLLMLAPAISNRSNSATNGKLTRADSPKGNAASDIGGGLGKAEEAVAATCNPRPTPPVKPAKTAI